MSQENVELVRRAYAHTQATRQVFAEGFAPGFIWDMSKYEGWPEQQRYEGVGGAQRFLDDWTGAWDDWELEVGEIFDVRNKVVVILHQSGRASNRTEGRRHSHRHAAHPQAHGRDARAHRRSPATPCTSSLHGSATTRRRSCGPTPTCCRARTRRLPKPSQRFSLTSR